jgi:hypothetical protein
MCIVNVIGGGDKSAWQGYFFGCSVALGVYFCFVEYGFVYFCGFGKFNWVFGVQIQDLQRRKTKHCCQAFCYIIFLFL